MMVGKFLHAGFLLLAASIVLAGEDPATAAKASPQPAVPASAPIDAAALWRQILEQADPHPIYDTFALVNKLQTGDGKVDEQACKANAQAIEDALKVNTVGLAIWYAAYQCANALHDEGTAAKRLAVFSELVRYALKAAPQDLSDRPIRVLSELDVVAFIQASGQELLYVYYEPPIVGRYLAINLGLWDPQAKRERMLRFDYLDARVRLLRSESDSQFPAYRVGVARGFIQTLGKTPGSWAAEALQLQQALDGDNPAARMAQLESGARDGNFSAAMVYSIACLLVKPIDCAAKAVDLLLPYAEKSYSSALIMLALAYDSGVGVKRNPDNARKLIEAADRRLGDGRGTTKFAALSLLRAGLRDEVTPLAKKSVEALADEHKPAAELIAASIAIKEKGVKALDAKHMAYLGDAAQAGIAPAQSILGLYLIEAGKTADGSAWIERAAEQGDAGAQQTLAHAYETGSWKEKNPEPARKWYAEAGLSGDRPSMLWMARYYAGQPVSAKTRHGQAGWLESAMDTGSVDAALQLAALYQQGGEGIDGNEKDAAHIYRALAQHQNSAEARRRLASMLVYAQTIDHDAAEAQRLLRVDADHGDLRSRVQLGLLMARGNLGKDQVEAGRGMLEKAAKEGDVGALVEYGIVLYYGEPSRRKDALAYFQQAADKGDRTALNNLAWAYCTAPEPAIIDAKRGVELTEKLVSTEAPMGYLDTAAACYANAGDFDRAAKIEEDLLAKLESPNPPFKDDGFAKNLRERIVLYRKHQAYREQVTTKN